MPYDAFNQDRLRQALRRLGELARAEGIIEAWLAQPD